MVMKNIVIVIFEEIKSNDKCLDETLPSQPNDVSFSELLLLSRTQKIENRVICKIGPPYYTLTTLLLSICSTSRNYIHEFHELLATGNKNENTKCIIKADILPKYLLPFYIPLLPTKLQSRPFHFMKLPVVRFSSAQLLTYQNILTIELNRININNILNN